VISGDSFAGPEIAQITQKRLIFQVKNGQMRKRSIKVLAESSNACANVEQECHDYLIFGL
jgi:hypothetical protein